MKWNDNILAYIIIFLLLFTRSVLPQLINWIQIFRVAVYFIFNYISWISIYFLLYIKILFNRLIYHYHRTMQLSLLIFLLFYIRIILRNILNSLFILYRMLLWAFYFKQFIQWSASFFLVISKLLIPIFFYF
jgi:hypothetical protein